jgi:hypothetical protein
MSHLRCCGICCNQEFALGKIAPCSRMLRRQAQVSSSQILLRPGFSQVERLSSMETNIAPKSLRISVRCFGSVSYGLHGPPMKKSSTRPNSDIADFSLILSRTGVAGKRDSPQHLVGGRRGRPTPRWATKNVAFAVIETHLSHGLHRAHATYNTFNVQRHLTSARTHRAFRASAMQAWREVVAAA